MVPLGLSELLESRGIVLVIKLWAHVPQIVHYYTFRERYVDPRVYMLRYFGPWYAAALPVILQDLFCVTSTFINSLDALTFVI